MRRYTQFVTTPTFRQSFSKLTAAAQEAARETFRILQEDPFDPRLRPEVIKSISLRYRKTIYAVGILGKLRAVFYLQAGRVILVDLEVHEIYG